jgi:hypothetical protein
MVLTINNAKKHKAVWRAWRLNGQMKRDLLIVGALLAFIPIACVLGGVISQSSAIPAADRSAFLGMAIGGSCALVCVGAAVALFAYGYRYHSAGLGLRCDQNVVIESGWLIYSFRVAGDWHVTARNVIVVRLEYPGTTASYDRLGCVALSGNVWRFVDLDAAHPFTMMKRVDGSPIDSAAGRIPPVEQLEYIRSFSIPDAFMPELMEAIQIHYVVSPQ